MVGLSLTKLMPSLATSTANAALPSLARNYAASYQAAQWIVRSYLLTVTTLIVAVGRLGDIQRAVSANESWKSVACRCDRGTLDLTAGFTL